MDGRAGLLALALIGIALGAVPPAGAAGPTLVEGPIWDRVWTLDGSPYILVGNATVPEGSTLEIREGVHVLADRGVGLHAVGSLAVLGTASAPVRFAANATTPDAGFWKGISATSHILLSHAEVEDAETALSAMATEATVIRSHVSGNLKGVQVQEGSLVVEESSFSENGLAAVSAHGASVSISKSLFSGNGVALDVRSSESLVQNTTFVASRVADVTLDQAAHVELRACEREGPLKFADDASRVDVTGLLTIGVRDLYGTPVHGARVRVDDNANSSGFTVAETREDGRTPAFVVAERWQMRDAATDFNPFTVTAESNGWERTADILVHRRADVSIALTVDLAPPEPVDLGTLAVDEDAPLVLDASASTDNDPRPPTFTWSFPEIPLVLEGVQTTVTFPTPGTYEGMLAVTDLAGNTGYASFTVLVRDLTPPTLGAIRVPARGTAGESLTFEATATDNDPAFPDGGTYLWRFTLGSTATEREGPQVKFASDRPGPWDVSLVVRDASGNGVSREFRLAIVAPTTPSNPWPALAGGSIALAAAAGLATERGRVGLLSFLLPLYTRLKNGEVLDQFTRGQIYGYVRVHPGDTYTDIKRNLDLNSGTLTYHLAILEKQGLLRSAVRGSRKMFYPIDVRPPEDGGGLHEIQQRLLRGLGEAPGIAVTDLAASIGISRQLALYHLRILAGRGVVRLGREGLRLCGYLPAHERTA